MRLSVPGASAASVQSLMRALALASALLAVGCASTRPSSDGSASRPPQLRLTPQSFGQELSLHQQLRMIHGERQQTASALLEIDPSQLRLALIVGPRRMLSLTWDGKQLIEHRDPALPPSLQGARFVDDIHLAYWPTETLRARLPIGWTLTEGIRTRELQQVDGTRVRVRYSQDVRWLGHIVIEHLDAGYALEIDSELLP